MNAISQDKMLALLEAFAPDVVKAIREGGATSAAGKKGHVFISEAEKKYYPDELVKLAEAASSEWSKDDFSIRRWMDAVIPATRKLREAHPETALAFLLRKGVQTLANDWYIVVPREWQDYCGVAQSNAVAEWYPPLYASTVAGLVARGDRFPEGRIQGEDSVLVNYKFGLIESFDRELFDDDQTGQIRLRAARLGQSMAITENAYAGLRFTGDGGTYANLTVPASKYTTLSNKGDGTSISVPFSFADLGNRPSSFGQLSLTLLKQAWSDLLNMKDPQGNKIIVNPNTLLVSSMDALHAPMLVKPPQGVPYYPAPIGASGETASTATSGFPGGIVGANPFMGLGINPVVARFLKDWVWALGEKGKGYIWQERDPLEVVQENVASGAAFEVDAYRFRSRRRFEVDWIGGGSRFWWEGNDGSVTGSF